jgi:hypothetical protein
MSEESWEKIYEADNKDQWATLLELCKLHFKENPEDLPTRIPQAVFIRVTRGYSRSWWSIVER